MENIDGFAVTDVGAECIVTGVGSGTIRFVGFRAGTKKARVGVEFNKKKGDHDGTVGRSKYFTCAANHGTLVGPGQVRFGKTLETSTRTSRRDSTSAAEPETFDGFGDDGAGGIDL